MQLYVDKSSDQMRSTFIAIGLAELLSKIPPPGVRQTVTIYDQGSCYLINSEIDVPALTTVIEQLGFLRPLLPAISKPLTASERKLLDAGKKTEEELLTKYVPPGFTAVGGKHVKYGAQKEIFDAYRKYRPKKNQPRSEDAPPAPHPDFPVWAHLNSYFGKGSAMRVGYPSLVHTWHVHQGEAAIRLWQLIGECYGNFPNQIETSQLTWTEDIAPLLDNATGVVAAETTALAVVSPSTSKGVSAASGFNLLREDPPVKEFWLEMYFAFAGFLTVAMPYNLSGDVVTYYPLPDSITFSALTTMMNKYRKSGNARSLYRYSSSYPRIKLDTLNQIIFYTEMVEHLLDAKDDDGTLPDDVPLDIISGLVGYYYKNISTQIPFDETLFSMPAWLPHSASVDVLDQAKEILKQHYNLVSRIRGKPPKYQITADELRILESYRRYVTHGEADDWITFTVRFGLYRFQHMTEMNLPSFSFKLFKESFPMVLNDRKDFRPILDDPGFRKIASAINYCTAYSRYKKDVQKDRTFPFKVRHGLGDDLMRNAHDPELFLLDLSKFVHDYRRESINVQANSGKARPEIEPDDLHKVTALIAEYGSRIVAHLLVAVGYAVRFGSDN